ncbi:glycosyl hydrolase 53 family protein [Chloroflexota bacterium]
MRKRFTGNKRNIAGHSSAGRHILPLLAFLLLLVPGCTPAPAPQSVPAPSIAPVTPPVPAASAPLTEVAAERFATGIEGWEGVADAGATSEVVWDSGGRLIWSVRAEGGQIAGLSRQWPALTGADGLTIRLTSLDRYAFLLLAVTEADGSAYSLVLPVDEAAPAEHTVSFAGFSLHQETEDENGQLDPGQLATLTLVDISAAISAAGPNRVSIEEIVLWRGVFQPDFYPVAAAAPGVKDFRVGVDANFVPQGERANHPFRAGGQPVDPLELFAANGANGFRLRLWVGDDGESKLGYATDLAKRAAGAGLRPYLVLFLAEGWADVNKQPAPAAWANLAIPERAAAVRQYAFETAQHFADEGITLDFYEIGNEIDYGICGVFADTATPRDIAYLSREIWPDEARFIQAAVEGVRQADPDARIMLHIASSWDPPLAAAFFREMADAGVEYDYMGFSHYPTAFGTAATARLFETLDRLRADIGKPVIIAEAAYPAEVPSGGLFGDWRHPLPGYPMTPLGQAWWLADLLKSMRSRPDVLGVYLFSPEFWFSGELWGPFSLFDGNGEARPAIGSLKSR